MQIPEGPAKFCNQSYKASVIAHNGMASGAASAMRPCCEMSPFPVATLFAPVWLAGGSLMRGEEQDRIDFLAQARNRALEPLWLSAAALSDTSAAAHGGLAKEMAAWDLFSARDTSNTMWQAQKIVFFNDVYFCAQDVFR